MPSTKKEKNAFAGLANVRVTNIRVWIKGIKTKDNEVQVDIIHCGKEEIVDSSGNVFYFNHKIVPTIFRYNTETMDTKIEGEIRNKDDNADYAQLSPFTTWRIKVNPDYNLGLDLSNISNIKVEFFGTSYSFD